MNFIVQEFSHISIVSVPNLYNNDRSGFLLFFEFKGEGNDELSRIIVPKTDAQ